MFARNVKVLPYHTFRRSARGKIEQSDQPFNFTLSHETDGVTQQQRLRSHCTFSTKVAEKVLGRSMKLVFSKNLTITQFSSLVVGIHVPIGDYYSKKGNGKRRRSFFLPCQTPLCARCFAPACSHDEIERKME